MTPTHLPVLIAAALAATATAIDFGSQNDITQSAATVAPDSETQASSTGSYDPTNQWTQTASSSNNVHTVAPSSMRGSQGWSQPTTTDSPSSWTPTSDQASGSGNQGWPQPASTDASNSWTPSSGVSNQGGVSLECSGSSDAQTPEMGGYSLECSGSDETSTPGNDYSLECSGSDEQQTQGSQPSVSTSTAGSSKSEPTTTTAPSTPSGTSDQTWSQPSSTASSSNTATSAASGEYEGSNPTTSSSNTAASTASSGTGGIVDQGSSQTTQTSSTASSSDTASSSNTASSSSTAQSTGSSSNTGSSATQAGSDATQAQTSTNSTSSGDHATFGTITSKSGECVVGNPNKYVSTADIDWIWTNRIGPNAPTRDANWNVMDNKNWIMDHIVKNKGSLNYCVRWDSTEKLSKSTASKFQAMLERQYAAWNHWLVGYDCWPYNEIKINVVGWAVKDASLLEWTDDSMGTITVGDLDSDGVPQCDQKCYRFYDNAPQTWSDTSGCKGEPFDISLWPKQGLEGGFGYDWGQEVNLENMLSTLDQDELVIVAHEIGHGFGLPDFYEDADKPNAQWPTCIMMAGSSMTVTDSDGWMLRRVLEHLKPRYNF